MGDSWGPGIERAGTASRSHTCEPRYRLWRRQFTRWIHEAVVGNRNICIYWIYRCQCQCQCQSEVVNVAKITSSVGRRHNMPPPPPSWPLTLNGIRVLCANFSLHRPLCSQFRLDVRDRQTDVRRAASLNARGGDIKTITQCPICKKKHWGRRQVRGWRRRRH